MELKNTIEKLNIKIENLQKNFKGQSLKMEEYSNIIKILKNKLEFSLEENERLRLKNQNFSTIMNQFEGENGYFKNNNKNENNNNKKKIIKKNSKKLMQARTLSSENSFSFDDKKIEELNNVIIKNLTENKEGVNYKFLFIQIIIK